MSKPLSAFRYDAEGRDSEITLDKGTLAGLGRSALLWIDIPDADEAQIDQVAKTLELDPRLLTALRRKEPRYLVENYGDYHHFTVCVPPPGCERGDPIRLDFVVGASWLVSVHKGPVGFLGEFRKQDKGETKTGTLSGTAFAGTLLDWQLEVYFREVAEIEETIDDLDDRILDEGANDALLEEILGVRRRVSSLRRLLAAQRPVFYGLERPDVIAASPDAAEPHAARLVSRYERALDEIERTRELLLGSFELLSSRTAQTTNELVKALTFFTVIIGSAAAVAGLFGMNFDPPFFKSGSVGFFAVVLGLLLLSGAAFAWAKHKRWL